MIRWCIIIALLFVVTGCDEFRRNAECRKVERVVEGATDPDPLRQVRAFEEMETMTAVETLLTMQVINAMTEGSDRSAYLLCMEMNR